MLKQLIKRIFGSKPAPPPPPRKPIIHPDARSIDVMVFCGEAHPTCGDLKEQYPELDDAAIIEKWHAVHAGARTTVRELLRSCSVEKAGDVNTLGCTGAIAKGVSIERAQKLIIDLAGSGVGLPCFVPQTRFCLVHNTIGGLQDGQKQHHVEKVEEVSRELTPEEQGHVALTEASRRARGDSLPDRIANTLDLLSGYELPKGFEVDKGGGQSQ